jgi:putative transposase
MPRLPRSVADGLVYHALNRGNNRGAVFEDDDDRWAFLQALAKTQRRYPFELFGYCLMTNHFHLLLRPSAGQSISRIMQSLTVAHTRRYHQRHGSVGHVWQGRFKSPLIQADEHLLTVLRYIEANPLRAGMVKELETYRWSSYPVHGLGRADELVAPFPGWETFARTEAARLQKWRTWAHTPLTAKELDRVRQAVVSGRPLGAPSWVEATARQCDIPLGSRPRGRPRKAEVE